MGGSINRATPIAGWFGSGKIPSENRQFRGTPHDYGNPQILLYLHYIPLYLHYIPLYLHYIPLYYHQITIIPLCPFRFNGISSHFSRPSQDGRLSRFSQGDDQKDHQEKQTGDLDMGHGEVGTYI